MFHSKTLSAKSFHSMRFDLVLLSKYIKNMKDFLKPSKITWISLGTFLIFNSFLFFLGIEMEWGLLWYMILAQIGWLYGLIDSLGVIDVGGRGIFAKPNVLGWLFIILGALISLTIYYFIASVIAFFYGKNKNTPNHIK